ncbi:MAG: GNAT family N-acetyltransferase [Candidatus Bathyarchaeota archaeon]|jgi:GNAT superfamily N-acetyltransferase
MAVIENVGLEGVTEDDVELLAEISERAFDTDLQYGSPGEGGPKGYDSPEFYLKILEYLDCYTILLEGDVVGGVMVGSRLEGHKILERIFVDPTLHRRGIGTRAMELVFDRYPEAGLWTLGTPEWNVRTKAFYESLGFVQVGWDLGHPDWRGRWYQLVVDAPEPYEMTPVEELRDGMKTVDVEGEILEKGVARQVRSRRRRWQTLTVANAGLGDESGRVVLVLWNEQIRQVGVGDKVRVEYGYVGSYRGVTQLNVGRAGKLIKLI